MDMDDYEPLYSTQQSSSFKLVSSPYVPPHASPMSSPLASSLDLKDSDEFLQSLHQEEEDDFITTASTGPRLEILSGEVIELLSSEEEGKELEEKDEEIEERNHPIKKMKGLNKSRIDLNQVQEKQLVKKLLKKKKKRVIESSDDEEEEKNTTSPSLPTTTPSRPPRKAKPNLIQETTSVEGRTRSGHLQPACAGRGGVHTRDPPGPQTRPNPFFSLVPRVQVFYGPPFV